MHHITGAIGKHVVEPIVSVVDVDGVVRRIDLNDALTKIDWDAQLNRIDLNKVLERVDVNRLVQRLDINDLVVRSDIGSVIAHSTTGIFTQVLDGLRTQVVLLDLIVYRFSSGCRFGPGRLPPKPTDDLTTNDHLRPYPHGRSNKAIAVQGRYTGFVSKALAILGDGAFVTFSFAVMLIIFELCWMFLSQSDEQKDIDRGNQYVVAIFCGYWFSYFFFCVLIGGQTLGMAIMGIRVISARTQYHNPRRRNIPKRQLKLGMGQVFVRTLLLPLSTTVFPFLGAFGFVRKDGRMLHDFVASTGIIYRWHAKMAKMREKTMYRELDHQTSSTRLTADDDDSSTTSSSSDGEEEDVEEQSAYRNAANRGMQFRPNASTGGVIQSTPSTSLLPATATKEAERRGDNYTTFDDEQA